MSDIKDLVNEAIRQGNIEIQINHLKYTEEEHQERLMQEFLKPMSKDNKKYLEKVISEINSDTFDITKSRFWLK